MKQFFIISSLLFSLAHSYAQQVTVTIKQGNDAYKKGDYKAAAEAYQKALDESPNNEIAQFNLGNALQKLKQDEASGKTYDELLQHSKDGSLQSKAYYNKALALLKQNNLEEAVNSFKQSLRLAPDDVETRENLQKALAELRQKQQQQQQQNKKQPPPPPKQQPPSKNKSMSRQMMDQKFNELRNQEKQLQKQLQKQKLSSSQQEKDW